MSGMTTTFSKNWAYNMGEKLSRKVFKSWLAMGEHCTWWILSYIAGPFVVMKNSPDDVPFVKAELSSARHLRPGFSVFSDTLSEKMLVDLKHQSQTTVSITHIILWIIWVQFHLLQFLWRDSQDPQLSSVCFPSTPYPFPGTCICVADFNFRDITAKHSQVTWAN